MANVNYIPYPKLKATDYNGNALVGGTITTYLNGTTTPAVTYTDYTGTVQNPNPFTLPANGEMSIWLINGTTYTIVVKDAMGNTIDTMNGISASSSVVISGDLQIFDYSLTDSNGSKYIKFTTTPAAVNYLTITDAATGNGPAIGVAGADGNIDQSLLTLGTGKTILGSATSAGIKLLGDQPLLDSSGAILESFTKAATAVNRLDVANAATGNSPSLSAKGSDTNVAVDITAKNGAGAAGTGSGQVKLPGQVTLKNDGIGAGVIASPLGTITLSKDQVIVGNTAPVGPTVVIDNNSAGPSIYSSGSSTSFTIGRSSNTPMTINSGAGIGITGSPIDEAQSADKASASTVSLAGGSSLGLVGGNYINITGTTTINSFGTVPSGAVRRLTFTGALVLTYNATSMILPGAANITTAAGDTAVFTSLGSGNWKCTTYTRANGHALVESSGGTIPGTNGQLIYNQAGVFGADTSTVDGVGNLVNTSTSSGNLKISANSLISTNANGNVNITPNGTGHTVVSGPQDLSKAADLASASTVNIGAATGNYVNITGTTTITAFDTIQAGTKRTLKFAGALTLTHNATSLILPTAANITTVAGDIAEMVSEGSGNWRCASYSRASGAALAGTVTIPGVSSNVLFNNSGSLGADASFTTDGAGAVTTLSVKGGNLTVAGNTITAATGGITLVPASGNAVSLSSKPLNLSQGADIASASTVALGAATGNYVNITGTTTITAFDTVQSGTVRTVTFSGILILTHNATSLILPTSANITTAAGDSAIFTSLGSGNWKCTTYTRASGAALVGTSGAPGSTTQILYNSAGVIAADSGFTTNGTGSLIASQLKLTSSFDEAKGADIASATTTDISAATGNFVKVTGTTTITALGSTQAGVRRIVHFTGALTLTYNATSLILPGSANIITVAGDVGTFISLGSGNWECIEYTRVSGRALVSGVYEVSTMVTAVATGTTLVPLDDTIPQSTEGDQYMALAYTPKSATSILEISAIGNVASGTVGGNVMIMSLHQDSTANALATVAYTIGIANAPVPIALNYSMTSGTTSATTFKIRIGGNGAGTTTFNGASGARLFGGAYASSIIIKEIL